MAVDAAREFRAGFEELQQSDVPFDLRRAVGDWYSGQFLSDMRHVLGKEPNINDYLPVGPAAYYVVGDAAGQRRLPAEWAVHPLR
jgi:hypothetical protein